MRYSGELSRNGRINENLNREFELDDLEMME
jgi:hypothetical protein